MSFNAWLQDQIEREDPIGDFARDVDDDSDFPTGVECSGDYLTYLLKTGASEEAIETFKAAYAEFSGDEAEDEEEEEEELLDDEEDAPLDDEFEEEEEDED